MHIIIGTVSALFILMILVLVHEGGHFFAARALGVRVNEFAIGMGPVLLHKKRKNTEFSVRLIPIGGYVAMDEDSSADADDKAAFNNKPWWARTIILMAGPFMNFILAVIVIAGLITYMGTSVSNQVEHVTDASPAFEAGMLAGDMITAVDGKAVSDDNEAALYLQAASKTSDNVEITVDRNGKEKLFKLRFKVSDDGSKLIGIRFENNHNPVVGLSRSFKQSVEIEKQIFKVLADLITGKGSVKDVSGPVGLVTIVDQVSRTGIFNMLYLMALLSLNLGLINILPFPALDGGRILFVFIRAVTGKVITDEIESKFHFAGIMILFMFMILITFKDIKTLITG
ncbi:MAG: RIP metalloprotease RseP [Anaerovoracaceae bacterium]